ncbi:MAG: HAD family hydrolase [Oscillospiraceae bacterium]|nr:HAD family hydrolase [Oscillospiraceae bacterium]
MLNTILFDLDGTLAPFMQDEFIRAYFRALLHRLTPMGYDGEKLTKALWKGTGAMVANTGESTNRQVFWSSFVEDLGMEVLSLESILEDFYQRDFDGVGVILTKQADRSELLRRLREKGYGLVLATNPIFPATAVETRLGWVGLCGEDFDLVTTYENSRHSKPSADYFRDILAAVGREAGECLMIGNNPVDDMAALELGMEGYLVTDCMENPDNLPIGQYRHGSFESLEAYLDSLPPIK